MRLHRCLADEQLTLHAQPGQDGASPCLFQQRRTQVDEIDLFEEIEPAAFRFARSIDPMLHTFVSNC